MLALAETLVNGWILPSERKLTRQKPVVQLLFRGEMGAGHYFVIFPFWGGLLADVVLTHTYHHSN